MKILIISLWKPVVVVYMRTALSENKVSLKKREIDNLRGSDQPKIKKYIRGTDLWNSSSQFFWNSQITT